MAASVSAPKRMPCAFALAPWLLMILALMPPVVFASSLPKPRHVLFIIIDDLGFGDVGYADTLYPEARLPNSTKPLTPTIDSLAINEGIRLRSTYVAQLCSPTRTSLLSGRYPYTIGMSSEVIVDGHPSCLPLNVKTLADHFKDAGWKTSAYGKWDAGMTAWGCTPMCRGFDYFAGFFNADNNYLTHVVGTGLDLRDGWMPDFANHNESDVYETELITTRVQNWLHSTISSDPSAKTFAYVAHQSNHGPNQVPLRYMTGYCMDNIPESFPTRRILCGMTRAVDESIANISQTYKDLGIWNDTLVIFTADNGGNPNTGGNNYPLRGMKATSFEGGVRAAAFVAGAGLDPSLKGTINDEFYHVSDWLPTLIEGVVGTELDKEALTKDPENPPPPLDGMNVWESISTGSPSPRTEALLTLIPTTCKRGTICKIPGEGAIRVGEWKLLRGHTSVWSKPLLPKPGVHVSGADCNARCGDVPPVTTLPVTAATSTPWCPNGWVPPPSAGVPPRPPPDVCSGLPCNLTLTAYEEGGVLLFNLKTDPFEEHNVADKFPEVVKLLQAKLEAFNATGIPQDNPGIDPASDPSRFGGVWTPWRGDPVPQHCSTNVSGAVIPDLAWVDLYHGGSVDSLG